MANKTALECTDQLLRYLTGNDQPFGNKPFVGIGDFRQVAPVVKSSGPSAVFDASIKSSYLWNTFQLQSLRQPIRDYEDLPYSRWVDTIGAGRVGQSVMIVSMKHLQQLTTYDEAIGFLFPDDVLIHPLQAIKRSFLSPYNMAVDEFNIRMVDRIDKAECMLLLSLTSNKYH